MMAAIDATADAVDRQAIRFKERRVLRSERRVDKEHRLPGGVAPESEEESPLPADVEIVGERVVRIKRFSLKPMTEAEAIEQMELLGHNFFWFHDADRDDLALLYRRRDGDYGMIIRETT